MQNFRTIVKAGSSLMIPIPAYICRQLNIQKGGMVSYIIVNENTFVLRILTSAEIENLKPKNINY